MASILESKRVVEEALMAVPGVAGVGVDWAGQKIRVYVERPTLEIQAAIPEYIAGYPVELIVTGVFETAADYYRQLKWRPVYGGISAAHYMSTAGTLGGIVRDDPGDDAEPLPYEYPRLLLSNNHVFANYDTVSNPVASAGDAIIQPSLLDAGTVADTIATLTRWVPINEAGENLVDCAVAAPIDVGQVAPYILGDPANESTLNAIGVRGTASTEVGTRVHKFGRTSGHTYGSVVDTDFSTRVVYGGSKKVMFVDQILACIRVDPGDSGSLLLDDHNNAVGLVIASAKAGNVYYTVANKIQNVEAMLGVRVETVESDTIVPGVGGLINRPVEELSRLPGLVWIVTGFVLGAVIENSKYFKTKHGG